ncbi:hypothetical protein HK405_005153 [Cladochytrium tenue]|nr:hypothetical protein HK405_005153 [Cladochytrium tenue]
MATAPARRPHASLPTRDVLTAYAVFGLCSQPAFVAQGPRLLDLARRSPLLEKLSDAVVKETFFRHFCGGETIEEVRCTMDEYRSRNVGVILNLALEADLGSQDAADPAALRRAAEAVSSGMQESVDLAAAYPHNLVAAKLTPFFPPPLLARWTASTLAARSRAFGGPVLDAGSRRLDRRAVREALAGLPGIAATDADALFDRALPMSGGVGGIGVGGAGEPTVDWIGFTDALAVVDGDGDAAAAAWRRDLLLRLGRACVPAGVEGLRANDFTCIDAIMEPLEALVRRAVDRDVKLIVDAEWTYVQAAIDEVAIALGQKYNGRRGDPSQGINGGRPVILNTYQMYLKDSIMRMKLDVERAKRHGTNVGVKLVRGAYMVQERERASAMGYPDPIHDTIEDTHKSYNSGVEFCLDTLIDSASVSSAEAITVDTPLPLQLFVASHNFGSAGKAMILMKEKGLAGSSDAVVPYGPVCETIPYLVRRAQENGSVLGGAWLDRKFLGNELRHRCGLRPKQVEIDDMKL